MESRAAGKTLQDGGKYAVELVVLVSSFECGKTFANEVMHWTFCQSALGTLGTLVPLPLAELHWELHRCWDSRTSGGCIPHPTKKVSQHMETNAYFSVTTVMRILFSSPLYNVKAKSSSAVTSSLAALLVFRSDRKVHSMFKELE